jgi:flagellar biosynthesis chaperone FliJ
LSKISSKVGLHLAKTVKHYFPDIASMINKQVNDARDKRGKSYSMHEAILSVVLMFLLKEGSRNNYNQDRAEPKFNRNIRRVLNIRLMHGDSFNDVLAEVDENELQKLKASLVRVLVAHKVFYPYRHNGKYIVAIDGTGTHSFAYDYSGTSLSKTSKNGVTTYSHAVLEAKLVAANGFCISLASAWIENNQEGEHDKQDCELMAFKRLAAKIKELYPRLPIVIVADALYANAPVMDICKACLWDYLLVAKEGVLKDLHEEIGLRPDKKSHKTKRGMVAYLSDLELGAHQLSWLRWEELGNSFSWIANMEIKGEDTATKLQEVGRLRWKIENEGFNTQKNLGYNLEHKYSRVSFNATKNYYQCMQIAHLIEQLALLGKAIKSLLGGKTSIMKLSERIRNILALTNIDIKAFDKLMERKIQIRFE